MPQADHPIAGVRTRCIEDGASGSAILLLHALDFARAGLCHNALAWELALPRLARSHRVIAFDAPGHGHTDEPATAEGYALDAMVAHARAVLSELGIDRVHLVAHGDSAVAATELAFAAPELVASCTIAGSAAATPAGDADINLTFAAPLRPLYSAQGQRWVLERQSHAPNHVDCGTYLEAAVAIAAAPAFAAATARQREAGAARRFRGSLARARTRGFVRFRTHGMPVPTLLVWGNQDPVVPLPFAQSLFALIAEHQPRTQLRVINRAGHMAFREQPAMFAEALLGFIRGIGG